MQTRRTGTKFTLRKTGGTGVYIKGLTLKIRPKIPGGWRGDPHMKQTGMLVVSLRGVNFGFWSRLGCSCQSANILSSQGQGLV